MSLFLRHLRAAWLFLRYTPYVEAYDHEDFWTQEDSAAYTSFMNSPSGQKLRARMGNLMTRSAVNATQHTHNPVYRNGWASGITATFSWLDSHLLSPAGAQPGKSEDSEQAASEFLETLRP